MDQDPDSNLHKAFANNGIKSPYDIIAMPEEAILALEFLDDKGNMQPVCINKYSLVLAF